MFILMGKKIIAGFNEIFMLSSLHGEGVGVLKVGADIQIHKGSYMSADECIIEFIKQAGKRDKM